MNIVLPSLFSVVFVIIGVALIGYARGVAAKAKRSTSWPSTEGVIAHSAVLLERQARTSASDSATFTHKADVFYRYKVKGTDYSCSAISLMDFSSTAARAETIVSRYPDNAKVAVYYNPSDPSEAVLEPGYTGGLTLLFAIGWGFAAAGVLFLLLSLTGHVHMRS